MHHPPTKKSRRARQWAERKKFQLKHLAQYVVGAFFNLVSRILKLHPDTVTLVRRSFELGNPTQTVWPSETIPMVSRLLAGGFWNFSFFQFNRGFYFPYWAEKQYDPAATSFIPRSHNVLSLNQTHRNWLSISYPGKPTEVSIDRAAAIMPCTDSYTIEIAILENGKIVRPHDEIDKVKISLPGPGCLEISWRGRKIVVKATVQGATVKASGDDNLVVSVRPFNYEGPHLLDRLSFSSKKAQLRGDARLNFVQKPDIYILSNLLQGDALKRLPKSIKPGAAPGEVSLRRKRKKYLSDSVRDKMGLATASFLFSRAEDVEFQVDDMTDYRPPADLLPPGQSTGNAVEIYDYWFKETTDLKLPAPFDELFFYTRTHLMTLWDYDSITPGSFTYHHFWIRDAVVMMHSLLKIGGEKAVKKILQTFSGLVKRNGLFHSQAGEWDANGQALWIIGEYVRYTGDKDFLKEIRPTLGKLTRWLEKEVGKNHGVLPPGFSAEHLGVADWYLWDNFWTLGGITSLSKVTATENAQVKLLNLYDQVHYNLERYLDGYKYFPAALGRKKDAGMIGSVSAVYPLNLGDYYTKRMLNTLKVIQRDHFYEGGFFQENIHSGINPYLSMQVAESFLLMGHAETAFHILEKMVGWANFGYTYPEAVHPHTHGGCMGDGFHGWAFAEIVQFLTNMFFLEKDHLPVFMAGVPEKWLKKDLQANNLRTPLGKLNIRLKKKQLTIENLAVTHDIYLALPKKWPEPRVTVGGSPPEICPWHKKSNLAKTTDRVLYRISPESAHLKIQL